MAVKPRIHWSWDGTKHFGWSYNGTWLLGSEWSDSSNSVVDGDELKSSSVTVSLGTAFEFPDLVQVHSIKLKVATVGIVNGYVYAASANVPTDYHPPGTDWKTLAGPINMPTETYTEIPMTQIVDCKWLLIGGFASLGYPVYCMHIFGEYNAPRFEYWDVTESYELGQEDPNASQYPLALPDAPNIMDYAASGAFKIYNTQSASHTYSVAVKPVKYGGDSIISTYYTVAKSPSFTKSGTVVVYNVPASGFSEELRIYADVPKDINPANGRHYFVIDTTETA